MMLLLTSFSSADNLGTVFFVDYLPLFCHLSKKDARPDEEFIKVIRKGHDIWASKAVSEEFSHSKGGIVFSVLDKHKNKWVISLSCYPYAKPPV